MRFPTVAVFSILATTIAAQRVAESEPNNSSGQAQVVTLGSHVDAVLAAGEEDWFEFTTAGGNVAMYAHHAVDVDVVFELYDSAGTTRLGVNDDTDGLFSAISLNLSAGTYQLRVTGWAPTTTGSYHLDIAERGTIAATVTESEPNDSLASADPVSGDDLIDGALSSGSDADWFQLTLTAPNNGLWFEIGEGSAPWVSNHRYEIYDAAGVLLAPVSTFGNNSGNSSPSAIRTSEVRSLPAGTYYIVIKNSTVSVGYGGLIPQGNYRLTLTTMPMGTSPIAETEPNNTIANATALAVGGAATGSVSNAAGSDPNDIYGPFTITGPTVMQFQTSQGTTGPLLDSTLRLLDDAGTAVHTWTFGNTLSPQSHARATVVFSVSGTFFIEVASPGGSASQAGSYEVEIGANTPPYQRATYDIAEVNGLCLGSNSLRPTITVDSPGERPVLGTTMSRTVTMLPASAPFFLLEGLSDTIALGSLPLPYDLGLHGAPDCFVHVDPVAVLLILGSPSGSVQLDDTMANSIVFQGIPIFEQAVALDLPANNLGITSSNYARKLLGIR